MNRKPFPMVRLAVTGLFLLLSLGAFWALPAAMVGQGSTSYLAAVPCRPEVAFLPIVGRAVYYPLNEAEPNNSYQQANGPLAPAMPYSGYGNDERDYFSFYLAEAGSMMVNLANHPGQGVQLQLFYQSTANLAGFDSTAPYSVSYNGQPGWYYIYIYTAGNFNTTNPYTLQAEYAVPPTPAVTPVPTPTCPPATATATVTPTPTVTQAVTPSPTLTPTVFGSWDEVGDGSATGGGISNEGYVSQQASVAVAPNGLVYVAWSNNTLTDSEIYVRSWNGTSWEEVGTGSASGEGISNNSGDSLEPSIAVAADGTPYIAWQDYSNGNYEIYVRYWNGILWEEVGIGSASGGGISNNSGSSSSPSLAIRQDGLPYVVWQDNSSGNDEIYALYSDGISWAEIGTGSAGGGGISNNSSDSEFPSLAISADYMPYATWQDWSGGDAEIYVRRFNGADWEEVGTGSANAGGISDNENGSFAPAIAIASEEIYITWYDSTDAGGDWEIYVRFWQGIGWEEVGSNSATGNGISNNSGQSVAPVIALDSNGVPYVAWEDNSGGGDAEIYVRRFNGSSWEEVGNGAATGGGISDNSADSYAPAITILPGTIPYVAWQDASDGNWEIYIRRWLWSH